MRQEGRGLHDTVVRPNVVVERGDTVTRIVVSGELDFSTVDHVRSFIETECERSPRQLELDLAAIEFADSHALRLLVATHRSLEDNGCRLVLVEPSEQVRRLLSMTGLDDVLRVQPPV